MVAIALKKPLPMSVDSMDSADIISISGAPKEMDRDGCEEVAAYISQMTGEMASMARSARLDLLAYFLEMARIEANGHSGKLSEPH